MELLTAEEERELAARVQAGDYEARAVLVERNLPLVKTIAAGFTRFRHLHEDMEGEGYKMLIHAAELYDGREGVRFASYAAYWIRVGCREAIRTNMSGATLPPKIVRMVSRWRRFETGYLEEHGHRPGDEAIRAGLQLTENEFPEVKRAVAVASIMPLEDHADPEEYDRDPSDNYLHLVEGLGAVAKHVVTRRLGLDGGEPADWGRLASRLRRDASEVRDIYEESLAALRERVSAAKAGPL